MAQPTLSAPKHGFISYLPASTWEEALLCGNGEMGAMVMSQSWDETIILNHERLFLPWHEKLAPVDTASHLEEIRSLIRQGKYQDAADLVVALSNKEGYGYKRWTDPFFPAADLRIKMVAQGDAKRYERTLNYATGLATGRSGNLTRRTFVSRADNVIAVEIVADRGSKVSCTIELSQRAPDGWWGAEDKIKRGIKSVAAKAEDGLLTYESHYALSDGGYSCIAKVITTNGKQVPSGSSIEVSGADKVVLLVRVLPDVKLSEGKVDVLHLLDKLAGASFDELLKRHANKHGAIFNRAYLDLGPASDDNEPAEKLVAASKSGILSPTLLSKLFDSGRYAIESSCGKLPPNLQGVWTGTWGAPWSGDYTQNGNVQTAIAGLLNGNMAECLESYFGYTESLLPDYRTNAKRMFGVEGINIASRTSTHGLNNHFDETWPMTFWTAGAGWAAQFYYDYWLYTGDRKFLKERALPFMLEAAKFYEGFLKEDASGHLEFNPSYSPENNPGNNPSQACINATMDISVAKELLSNLIDACNKLKAHQDQVPKWKSMLAKMPPYLVNADGALKEWATPLLEDNYAHRHCSHLYALFNGLPDEIARDPKLMKAFQVAIDKRMEWRRKEEGGGEMAFGLVQMGLAASSLGDRETVSFVIDRLARYYYYNNLASSHNPGTIFNTDISGGFPALVVKALVDSKPGTIVLLPACPNQMPKGRLVGASCRGQVTVKELVWSAGTVKATLVSGKAQTLTVVLPKRFAKASVGGASVPVSSGGVVVKLGKGETVVVEAMRR